MADDCFRSVIVVFDVIEVDLVSLEPSTSLFSDSGEGECGRDGSK